MDAKVSDKLRAKIWNNEYVDFAALLSNPILDKKFQISLSNPENGSVPSLILESVAKPKKITNIETWVNSFHVFFVCMLWFNFVLGLKFFETGSFFFKPV